MKSFRADINTAIAVLEPFAKEAERMRNYPDDYPYSIPTAPLTVGHLRAVEEVISLLAGTAEKLEAAEKRAVSAEAAFQALLDAS